MSDPTDLRGYRRPYPGSQPSRIHLPYASTRLRGPGRDPIQIPATLSEVTGPTLDRITL
ncbi:MAG: protocatechuate 3,4-dioxygenase subunit beta, partial [Stenotrophomonas sp.]